ncbi:hypothetical protein [Pontibacter amylolyticus]|uniref:Uncharacterized protein n=1 Tax=Pontibacter amylolyticus TaxID=1424080 RepID=A0ABQ1WAU7_9BACT|nr:hypothetical protein [Pontibacter amylolyticus]GGG22577.1 hypothetical protein GCM10011323_28150 [Pontibacter amylolyticus]
MNSLIQVDKSGFTEPVLTPEDYKLIERIVQADQQQMRADSVARIGRMAEGAEGRHVFSHILSKIEGKWLDSLAKERYKLSEFRHTPLD